MLEAAMPERVCKWRTTFCLSPSILLGEIRNTTDVRIVKDSNDSNAMASIIEIVTPELSYEDARNYACEVANRIADYLSFLKQSLVGATLSNIKQIPPTDSKIRVQECFATRRTVDRPTKIDMTAKPIAQIIGGQENKLARQLSHYRRSLETADVITRVREAYQIIEDEEPDPGFLEKYQYIRNLVSHPKLTHRLSSCQAKKRFGKPYIDPSSPKDLAKLREDAENLMGKAKETLLNKLSISEQ